MIVYQGSRLEVSQLWFVHSTVLKNWLIFPIVCGVSLTLSKFLPSIKQAFYVEGF
jgi:hypothetical protein